MKTKGPQWAFLRVQSESESIHVACIARRPPFVNRKLPEKSAAKRALREPNPKEVELPLTPILLVVKKRVSFFHS
mgnify:FL=1